MAEEPTRLSEKGAEFIARFEGFRSKPYKDAVGVWTIGYGHTSGIGSGSEPIPKQEALKLLRRDASSLVRSIKRAAKFRLNQHELDALVSFGYNLGPGYFRKGYTIGDALLAGKRKATADAMLLYDHAGGRVLLGLTRRRNAERQLFLDGAYS